MESLRKQTLSAEPMEVRTKNSESKNEQVHEMDGNQKAECEAEAGQRNELETPEERRSRLRSLRLLYAVTVLLCIALTVTSTTVWPYLSQIDESATKSDLGWVITVGPFGQLMTSTLVGHWANRRGSIKFPALICMIPMIAGNLLYALLYAFRDRDDRLAFYMMIVARFFVGLSEAFFTLTLSYIGTSTTVKERKIAYSKNASMQQIGYVLGPGLTALITIMFPKPIYTNVFALVFDENSASGWFAVFLSVISMIMLTFLEEQNIAEKEYKSMKEESITDSELEKLPSPSMVAIFGVNLMFVVLMFVPTIWETLATPLVADQYGLPDSKVVFVTSLTVSIINLMSIGLLLGIAKLTSKLEDRKALLFCALLPMLLSIALHYPIGDTPINYANCTSNDATTNFNQSDEWSTTLHSLNHYSATETPATNLSNIATELSSFRTDEEDDGCYGCPYEEQPWCLTTPQITPPQMVVAYLLMRTTSNTAITFTQALYSKILGPKPQGIWMGILSSTSATARTVGPLWISSVYESYGTIYLYSILLGIEAAGTLFVVAFYKYLVPLKAEIKNEKKDVGKVNLGFGDNVES